MECKENDVNDADIDDRFPADIEKAANRATLTFIKKLKITSVKNTFSYDRVKSRHFLH
jgi:hypothetical protein